MLRILVHNWWLLVLRGALALAFALFVFSVQTIGRSWVLGALALASVVEFFGLFAFCAGVCTIIAAIRGVDKERDWWLLLIDGAGACLAGVVAVALPNLTFVALVRLIGAWALLVGACELLMAHKLRRHVSDEWSLALAAVGSLAFGAYLFTGWAAHLNQLFVWLGSYALFSAVTMLALGLRLRKLRNQAHLAARHTKAAPPPA